MGAAVGLASSGGSSLLGDPLGTSARASANRANDERFHAALREIDSGRSEMLKSQGGERSSLLKALQASREGYSQAGGLLNAAASGSLLNASQSAQRAAGGVQAQMLQRGLGGSTAAGNAQRGVLADLQRTSAGITQQNAQGQAGLAAQGGESAALIFRQMSQQRAQEAQARALWRRMKVDALTGREDVAAPGWLPQTIGAAGSILGAVL